ncbi:MAG: flagellar protein [Lachnospiraceae bacterium]|nr:flagellar protein [Lachnospiraceae bacterium]
MNINNSQFLSNMQIQEALLSGNNYSKSNVNNIPSKGQSFGDILKQKVEDNRSEVRFSKHAMQRLENRNISLTEGQMNRLNEGLKQANIKGIKESLVLVDELAFIVNVPNSTVITAMNQNSDDDKVFTNIDGAVIA